MIGFTQLMLLSMGASIGIMLFRKVDIKNLIIPILITGYALYRMYGGFYL